MGGAAARLGLSAAKMVLCVRTDVGMAKGKMCAQCAHAALAAYRVAVSSSSSAQRRALNVWEFLGETKVVLRVTSEQELLDLQRDARSRGLVAEAVRDAGHTQVAAGTLTVLAIGPDDVSKVDAVTGHLKLL